MAARLMGECRGRPGCETFRPSQLDVSVGERVFESMRIGEESLRDGTEASATNDENSADEW